MGVVEVVSTLIELAGLVLVTIGGFVVAPALGFAVAGFGLILFGIALTAPAPPRASDAQPPQDH